MKISFVWGVPPKKDLLVIENNIREEIVLFDGRFKDFPDELIVRASLDAPELSVEGVATNTSGETVVTVSYSLNEPHLRHYHYVGNSPAV